MPEQAFSVLQACSRINNILKKTNIVEIRAVGMKLGSFDVILSHAYNGRTSMVISQILMEGDLFLFTKHCLTNYMVKFADCMIPEESTTSNME